MSNVIFTAKKLQNITLKSVVSAPIARNNGLPERLTALMGTKPFDVVYNDPNLPVILDRNFISLVKNIDSEDKFALMARNNKQCRFFLDIDKA